MMLPDDDCYLALKARDARFDGQFFTCVESTGIYCRPICPARTPKRDHCRFVATAAAAEDAGFRPCLRCRPETAPGSPEWLGGESLVRRALRILDECAADEPSLEHVARMLSLSSRQLRRLFADSLGTSPKSVIQTNRLAIARQLLVETSLPMTEVALASGFGSVRRFNAALQAHFEKTPTKLRQAHGRTRPNRGLTVSLGYRPPYAWDELLAHMRARSIAGLEAADGDVYVRTVRTGRAKGLVRVEHDAPRARMRVEFVLERTDDLSGAVASVRDLLDLDAVPEAIAGRLGDDERLREIVSEHPGLRFPGSWGVFETLVRAIVGQQVSVSAARTVLGRLVAAFGEPVELPGSVCGTPHLLFPEPAALARRDLYRFGLNAARAGTIETVARLFADDPHYVHAGMAADDARQRLLSVRGIGPWTADYVLLRALRYPDAFPAADLGALRAAGAASPRELEAMAERWRPWRGYALLYLWKMLETSAT